MKKLTGVIILGSALVLGACGNDEGNTEQNTEQNDTTQTTEEQGNTEETQVLTVGASNVPHAEILEFVAPTLEEEGIELTIETYTDYVIPNLALSDGDLDANYFQHIPYFESQVEENDYDFANAGSIHIEPLGAYSNRYDDLSELPENATILTSNSVPDHGRVLSILQEAGLIQVDESVELTEATYDDIVENELNLQFEYEYDPALLPTLYAQDEGDVFFINSNFAVDNDINPIDDSIALENATSPYANIVAVRSEDADNELISRLVEVLQSEETQDFILETWGGAVLPAED